VYDALAGVSQDAAEAWLSQTSDDGDGDDHGDHGETDEGESDAGESEDEDGPTFGDFKRMVDEVTGEFLKKKQAKGVMKVITELGSQLGLKGDDAIPLAMVKSTT